MNELSHEELLVYNLVSYVEDNCGGDITYAMRILKKEYGFTEEDLEKYFEEWEYLDYKENRYVK